MASDRSRRGSAVSSTTEAASHDEQERLMAKDDSVASLKGREEHELSTLGDDDRDREPYYSDDRNDAVDGAAGDDVEKQLLKGTGGEGGDGGEETAAAPKASRLSSFAWMVVNTLATIGIVFTNKAIFSDSSLKLAQLTFAAFHFFVTWLTLYAISRPGLAFFEPRRASYRSIIPLSVAMSLNVILPNLSLAFSSVTFYQLARILLTPVVALLNFALYGARLPRNAVIALIPACVGVGLVSYYDSLPVDDANVKTTSGLGVIFAFTGILASSLYTVWIAYYHRKLAMSSMQLLFNQAPVSAFLLLYVIPFVDTFPNWSEVQLSRWALILMVSSDLVGPECVGTCRVLRFGLPTCWSRASNDKSRS